LATWLASLASVLVGPNPMLVGSPVHCSTLRRRSRPVSARSQATPEKSRKHSSML